MGLLVQRLNNIVQTHEHNMRIIQSKDNKGGRVIRVEWFTKGRQFSKHEGYIKAFFKNLKNNWTEDFEK